MEDFDDGEDHFMSEEEVPYHDDSSSDDSADNDSSTDDSADVNPKPSSKGRTSGIALKRRMKARAKAYEEIPSQLDNWVSGIWFYHFKF